MMDLEWLLASTTDELKIQLEMRMEMRDDIWKRALPFTIPSIRELPHSV
jgi:hypothetical protein